MHFTVLVLLKANESLEDKLFPFYSQMSEDNNPEGNFLEYNYWTDSEEHWGYNTREELIKDLKPKIKLFDEDCIYAHNPEGRWDWYEVGGRWANSLLTKDGYQVDQCLVSELDIKGMENKTLKLCDGLYERAHAALRELSDKKERQFLWQQLYRELPELYLSPWTDTDEFFKNTKEEYYMLKKLQALCTHSLIDLEGNWEEVDEHKSIEWYNKIRKVIHDIEDKEDTVIIMVDCHN